MEIPYTVAFTQGGQALIKWENAAAGDTFQPVPSSQRYGEAVFELSGTVNGSITQLLGTLNGETFYQMHDFQSEAVLLTQPGVRKILEKPLEFKPISLGGSEENKTISILVRF